jgi:hypothetical protein
MFCGLSERIPAAMFFGERFPKLGMVSKSAGSSGNWGEFPKVGMVSKTGYGFQKWGEFWKLGGVSKTLLSGKNLNQ